MNAEDLIKQVSADPTINEVMRRDPRTFTRGDRMAIAEMDRAKRAAWGAKRDKRKAEKEEEDTESEVVE